MSERSPLAPSRLTNTLLPDALEGDYDIDLRSITSPGGDLRGVNAEAFSDYKTVLKACDGDMEKFRAEAFKLDEARNGGFN